MNTKLMKQFISLILSEYQYIFRWIDSDDSPSWIECSDEFYLYYSKETPEVFFNLDLVLKNLNSHKINCEECLDLINLMDDFRLEPHDYLSNNTYEKLFNGYNNSYLKKADANNLTWSKEEIENIKN